VIVSFLRKHLVGCCATLLVAAHIALVGWAIRANFVVFDEAGHLASGLSHWETGTYLAYSVNPPLPRMLATLPLLLAGPELDYQSLKAYPGVRPEWRLGRDLARQNAERYFDLACLARLSGLGWSCLAAWVIFRWASELYGPWGGLLSLSLWCLEPSVIALSGFVVPDVPAAASGVLAGYVLWKYLRSPSWPRAGLVGLLLGVVLLTKTTWLILIVLWPLLLLVWGRSRRAAAPPPPPWRHLWLLFPVALWVVNAGYGFSGSGTPLARFDFVSRLCAGDPPDERPYFEPGTSGNRFRDTPLARLPVPLPADFVRGIDIQRRDFELGLSSYLRGEWRQGGWWYFYLYALAVKVPLGTLLLMAAGVALGLWSIATGGASGRDECVLLAPGLALLVFVSSQTGFTIHMRYVLPAFPFFMIAAGKLVNVAWHRAPAAWPVAACVLWSALACGRVAPHFLSYFNEAAGGPEHGHEHLLDSNFSWGQDLFCLKDWLRDHPDARPVGILYQNLLNPEWFGIEGQPVPAEPWPGWYVVDVNYLHGSTELGSLAKPPGPYTYFQRLRPIDKAGYSLFIYRVTLEDANRVRRELSLPPLAVETPTP
jgi:hypothetical protein